MAGWTFVPITAQYLVGAAVAVSISFFILRKNKKSSAYKYFSLYGLALGLWMITTFLHRNAPESSLSSWLVTFSFSFGLLGVCFLFAALSALYRRATFLYLLPAIVFSIAIVFLKPLDAVTSDFGWSYVFKDQLVSIAYILIGVPYMLGIIIRGWALIKNSQVDVQRKKYKLFLLGFIISYLVGLSTSNAILMFNPNQTIHFDSNINRERTLNPGRNRINQF